MRGFLFCTMLSALLPVSVVAAVTEDFKSNSDEKVEKLDSTVVLATRAGKSTPVTYTMVYKEELKKSNPINSLPMSLNLLPSVVTVNEGGTGLGYSKMTIRGSKGSQINVTLNGITLNDSESQEVFWVNIPSLNSILSSVQVQRGLGTSANGAGAFGASINMNTASVGADPYANANFGYGSYNTFTSSVSVGSGMTKSGVYFDLAYSKNLTDGYIRNAKANVQSALAVLGWMNERNSVKLTYLMGDQHTGITWNGIDLYQYEKDRRYNSAGEWYEYKTNPDGSFVYDENGDKIVNSVHYYDNDTDNYTQHHLQLNYTHSFPNNLLWTTTLNFTKGDGYYENYKADKKFKKYGMADLAPAGFSRADFIVHKAMDNWYAVAKTDLKYTKDRFDLTAGLSYSRYNGDHFGDVLWCSVLGDEWNAEKPWYFNNAVKQEANLYVRAEYSFAKYFTAYADLQYRGVFLNMNGVGDEDNIDMSYNNAWHFFNPRAGLSFNYNGHKAYFSAALGNREPGRADIKENLEAGSNLGIKPEQMFDFEIGYTWTASKFAASANVYLMEYWNMLLETGRLSDSGYAIKDNVDRSFRRGIELALSYMPVKWFSVDANATLSLNKIKNYKESFVLYDDYWDYVYGSDGKPVQEIKDFGSTTMLMSPSVISMIQLNFKPFVSFAHNSLKTTTLSLNGKFVSKQFIDNTMAESRSIPSYFVANLALTHSFSKNVNAGFYINNLFNNMYYADGWCYKGISQSTGEVLDGIGIFPQAPINFMLRLGLSF